MIILFVQEYQARGREKRDGTADTVINNPKRKILWIIKIWSGNTYFNLF